MKAAAAKLRMWRKEPVTFVKQVLNAEPDSWQAEVLNAAAKHNRIALKASKGPGKSTILAWLGWWFLLTRPHPKVVATSITKDNLRDNLWTELSKWQQKSELLTAAFTWSAERIVAKQHPQTWWASARAWPKDADPAQQANTLAGIHGDHVLFLIDESGGIPDAVLAAAEGGLANADPAKGTEAILVQAGNPTELSGPLYRACTRERHLWFVKEISGDPDDPNRAPRVSIQWAREQIEKYGRDNPFVVVNVFGQFPPSQANALISLDDATIASRRSIPAELYCYAPKILGVDVARFGDDRSVIFPRQGRLSWKPRHFRNLDTMALADQVAFYVRQWQPDAVAIDQTGVGSGVVDRMRQLGHSVLGVDSSSAPAMPRFLNKRAEMWAEMNEWIRGGGCLPDDSELLQELAGPTYKYNTSGKLVLESKDDMKKRGLASPDLADALALTFSVHLPAKDFKAVAERRRAVQATDFDPWRDAAEQQRGQDFDPFDDRRL